MDACTNPDILRVIWFFKMIIDIVKIIIPIALIILGIVDFSKSMITNDDGVQKKNTKLFAKRILYAILVFVVPWMVEVIIVTLGNFLGEEGVVNFTDCLENANGKTIQSLEEGKGVPEKASCWYCFDSKKSEMYHWGLSTDFPTDPEDPLYCNGTVGWIKQNKERKDCGVEKCYECSSINNVKYWGIEPKYSDIKCSSWSETNEKEAECGEQKCYICQDKQNLYHWGIHSPIGNTNCHSGWVATNIIEGDCGIKKCHICISTGNKYWGTKPEKFSGEDCHAGWIHTNITEENCK